MKLALIGEYNPDFEPHVATASAITHSADLLNVDVEPQWISTADITPELIKSLAGAWILPGSPYKDMERTLQLIRHARLNRIPCLGTCGGFQHMVIEYARNELNILDAEHAEYDPEASRLIISQLACSLAGREMQLMFNANSRVATIYGSETATERYYCNFGVNPEFTQQLSSSDFRIAGWDAEGEARVMEIADHPFYIGTLFVPQAQSTTDRPHPLVTEFLRAVVLR